MVYGLRLEDAEAQRLSRESSADSYICGLRRCWEYHPQHEIRLDILGLVLSVTRNHKTGESPYGAGAPSAVILEHTVTRKMEIGKGAEAGRHCWLARVPSLHVFLACHLRPRSLLTTARGLTTSSSLGKREQGDGVSDGSALAALVPMAVMNSPQR